MREREREREDSPRHAHAVDPAAGVCRLCGCDETHACADGHGRPCGWHDASRTLCSECARRGGPPPGFPSTAAEWRERAGRVEAYLRCGLPCDATALVAVGLAARPPRVADPFLVRLALEEFLGRASRLGHRPSPIDRATAGVN